MSNRFGDVAGINLFPKAPKTPPPTPPRGDVGREYDRESLNLPNGIYFGISDDQYFGQKGRYSQSELKGVIEHPNNAYLQSELNPLYDPKKVSSAMIKGSLIHHAVLEPKKFKEECTPDFISKNQTNFQGYSMGCIASKIFERIGCFKNGLPELAIFFTWNGEKFRAKFDYIRPDITLDLKTHTPPYNGNIKPYNLYIGQGYYIQQFLYQKARLALSQYVKKGMVYGANQHELDVLKQIAKNPLADFFFQVLNLKTYEVFPFFNIESDVKKLAEIKILEAIQVIEDTRETGLLAVAEHAPQEILIQHIPSYFPEYEELMNMELTEAEHSEKRSNHEKGQARPE